MAAMALLKAFVALDCGYCCEIHPLERAAQGQCLLARSAQRRGVRAHAAGVDRDGGILGHSQMGAAISGDLGQRIMRTVQTFQRACKHQRLRIAATGDQITGCGQILGREGGGISLRARSLAAVGTASRSGWGRERESGHQRIFRGGLRRLWAVVAF